MKKVELRIDKHWLTGELSALVVVDHVQVNKVYARTVEQLMKLVAQSVTLWADSGVR